MGLLLSGVVVALFISPNNSMCNRFNPVSMRYLQKKLTISILASLAVGFVVPAWAYQTDIDYVKLDNELGDATPDGNGVLVSHVEADTSGSTGPLYSYLPDTSDSRFSGKVLNSLDMTGLSGSYSNHATSVGANIYGIWAMASGISDVHNYLAHARVPDGEPANVNNWLQANYLYWGSNGFPLETAERVANLSWVGSVPDSSALRRLDWVVAEDEFMHVVGSSNSPLSELSMFGAAFNVIVVGRTDGNHGTNLAHLDATYSSSRNGIGIVVPRSTTSSGTGVGTSAVAMLIETGREGGTALSNGSTTNRIGSMIYNAERSETLKAAVFAGADRITSNVTTAANITDYRINPAHQADNGMDTRFGAGQLNAYNSYHIVAAGEQDSAEDGTTGQISPYGFDYDGNFGGSNGTNPVASYYFSTGSTTGVIRASLVWNIDIAGGNRFFSDAATFHDLDLELHDVTNTPSLVVTSNSTADNSENIWESLQPNRDYQLKVIPKGSTTFNWDYALAWVIENDTDGDKISDGQDTCISVANPTQSDFDADGIGDACDTDADNDGVDNTVDAFPYDPTESVDTDLDGIGNNADTDDDNDGLSDTEEGQYGTDPLNFDTDDDGLNDYDEVITHGTNPNHADTDLDGIDDAQEIALGLDPTVSSKGHLAPRGTPDNELNIGDLVVLQRIVFEIIEPTPVEFTLADFNDDGELNIVDVLKMQQTLMQ